jgi:3-oxoacyl-[acyl-carrier protein] reductase
MTRMLEAHVAIVTGAGRGIGRAVALRLAREGARLVLADIVGDRTEVVAGEIEALGGGALALAIDTTDRGAVDAMIARAIATWGRIDILVNNAAIARSAAFLETSQADWDDHLRINLTGYFNCAQAAAREMAKTRYGRIVSIASIAGLMGALDFAAYGTTKAGVIGLTRAMAIELSDFGITANAIAPGPIDTELLREAWSPAAYAARARHVPIERLGKVEEIAHTVLMLAAPEAGYISGVTIPVDGGASSAGSYMSEKYRRRT